MNKRQKNLENEYREAIYGVFADEKEIIFRVGEMPEAINSILIKQNAANFAFITAFNPRSEVLANGKNRTRQAKLKKLLVFKNFEFLEGYGAGEREVWEKEESFFIFNISLERACEIGKDFQQNAILYGRKNERIEIFWCLEN